MAEIEERIEPADGDLYVGARPEDREIYLDGQWNAIPWCRNDVLLVSDYDGFVLRCDQHDVVIEKYLFELSVKDLEQKIHEHELEMIK